MNPLFLTLITLFSPPVGHTLSVGSCSSASVTQEATVNWNPLKNYQKENMKQRRQAGPPKGAAADYLLALLRFEPWAELQWHDYAKIANTGYFGDGTTGGNGGIRGTCGIALSYAVLAREFPNAPERQHRIKRVEAALRYAEETHESGQDKVVAVDGKKWGVLSSFSIKDGRGWQSSLWAGSMGFAAALLEKELDPKVVEGCKRVVAEEADWLSKKMPASGFKFDTKAEENAWQSNIVTLAAAWMSRDPRADKWLKTAKLYLVNTYTVPTDSLGKLKEWIKTQTLFPSYALENHGFYHPTYQMVAGMSLGDSYLMANIINPKMAQEILPFAEHNVKPVWQFLQGILLNSGDLAFPSGLDWSLHSFEHISYLAWLSTHFNEPQAQWAEPGLAKEILYRQAINGDGRFVGESCPDGFYREAVEARRIAIAFLHDEMAQFPVSKGLKPKNYIAHYSDAKLMVQRSENALTTVSYGTKTMALVTPLNGTTARQQFLISPNTSSFIGGDGNTKLNFFKKTKRGFRAELKLDSKTGRKSTIIIESTPEAIVFVEIPAEDSKLPSGELFLTAIENDPLTGGERKVLWNADSTIIQERSGVSAGPVSVHWLNVDNRIGFITASEGDFIYRAASKYNRNGAAEDAVVFRPAESSAPRAVIVLPGKNAKVTAKVEKSLTWTITGNKCKVDFKMPGGKKMKIKVDLNKD